MATAELEGKQETTDETDDVQSFVPEPQAQKAVSQHQDANDQVEPIHVGDPSQTGGSGMTDPAAFGAEAARQQQQLLLQQQQQLGSPRLGAGAISASRRGSGANGNNAKQLDIYDLEFDLQIELSHRMQLFNGRYYFQDSTSTSSIFKLKQDYNEWDRKNHFRSCALTMNQSTLLNNNVHSHEFYNCLLSCNLESFANDKQFKMFENLSNASPQLGATAPGDETLIFYNIKGEVCLNNKCLELTQDFIDGVRKLLDRKNSFYNWKELVSEFGDFFITQAWVGQKTWVKSKQNSSKIVGQIGNADAPKQWKVIKILKMSRVKDIIKQDLIENADRYKYSEDQVAAIFNDIELQNGKYLAQRAIDYYDTLAPADAASSESKEDEKNAEDLLDLRVMRVREHCRYKVYRLDPDNEGKKVFLKIDTKGFIHASPDSRDTELICTFVNLAKDGSSSSSSSGVGAGGSDGVARLKSQTSADSTQSVQSGNSLYSGASGHSGHSAHSAHSAQDETKSDAEDNEEIVGRDVDYLHRHVGWKCAMKTQFNKYLAPSNSLTEWFFRETKSVREFELNYVDGAPHFLRDKDVAAALDIGTGIQMRIKNSDIKLGGYYNWFQLSVSKEKKKQQRLIFRRWDDIPADTFYLERAD